MTSVAALCVGLAVTVAASAVAPTTGRIAEPRAASTTVPTTVPISATHRRLRRSRLAAVAVLPAITVLVGPLPAAAVGIAIGGWPHVVRVRAARTERRQIAVELPDTIDLFVLAVHAGLTPRLAIEQLAHRAPPSTRPGCAAVTERLRRGDVFADALRALDDHLGPAVIALTGLLGSADRHGLPIGPVLEQLANESRTTRRRLDEAAARALPVRLSFPLVVCTLPSFVLLAIVPAVLAALSSLGGTAW